MSSAALEPPATASPTFLNDIEPYRQHLLAHCYRMLGSYHDAEDAVQDTLIRAWKSLDNFEARGSLKNWLYKIATNVCLNVIAKRQRERRYLPDDLRPPAEEVPGAAPALDVPWLEPIPGAVLDQLADPAPTPETRYETLESVSLAFIAAVQHLPPKQRATLLLLDVLGWSAAETAALLDTSVASVNSAVQRARHTLGKSPGLHRARRRFEASGRQQDLLQRYVKAWEGEDLDGFVALLKEDATLLMPPWGEWYYGRGAIRRFLEWAWAVNGPGRLVATTANGQPAFIQYLKSGTPQQPHAVWVPEVGEGIQSLIGFRDRRIATSFKDPQTLTLEGAAHDAQRPSAIPTTSRDGPHRSPSPTPRAVIAVLPANVDIIRIPGGGPK